MSVFINSAVFGSSAVGYRDHPEAQKWLEGMETEAFSESYLRSILVAAKKKDSILKAMNRPAEKRLDWGGYRKLFIQPKRIARGVDFWNKHAQTLQRAEQVYGVPAEVIVSIIGIETHYGRNTGNFRALDALATLGFDYPRRATFFQSQLKDLLVLARNENLDVTKLKSSYAGAMGYGQFMPSSFLAYAVDFDQDGKKDLWNNPVDAIGSVANYFLKHGWEPDGTVVSAVALEYALPEKLTNTGEKPQRPLSEWKATGVGIDQRHEEHLPAVLLRMKDQEKISYWLGYNNYYVITRYNRSRLYAMAVLQLSEEIKAKKLSQ
jgi:membrane-bound lytic murein transglycosylase B